MGGLVGFHVELLGFFVHSEKDAGGRGGAGIPDAARGSRSGSLLVIGKVFDTAKALTLRLRTYLLVVNGVLVFYVLRTLFTLVVLRPKRVHLPVLPTIRGSYMLFGLAAPNRSLTSINVNADNRHHDPHTRIMATARGQHAKESRWLPSTVLPAVRRIRPLYLLGSKAVCVCFLSPDSHTVTC